jgi:SAM-dependent methyltransferase
VHVYLTIYGLLVIACIMILWSYRHLIKPYFEKIALRQRLHGHNNTQTLEHLLESLYSHTNAHQLSRKERDRLEITSGEFVYGEIVFLSFIDLLKRLAIKPHQEIFYDLGSGSGKAVITAALSFDFAKVVGIELLPSLYELANKKVAELRTLIQWHTNALAASYQQRIKNIYFINANINDCQFTDATLLFVNATCYHPDTWDNFIKKFILLPVGARIVISTKTINHGQFKLLFQEHFLMSWGMSRISAYEKVQ